MTPALLRTRPMSLCLLLGGVAGCLDYSFFPIKDARGVVPDTGLRPLVGLDDPDARACDQTPSTLEERVGIDETCIQQPVTGSIQSRVEWSTHAFRQYPEYDQVLMSPVVGQLSDDNGDGQINSDDVPDVVVITDSPGINRRAGTRGVLRVLDGDTGAERIAVHTVSRDDFQATPYRYANVALGDIDLDGSPDIVTMVEAFVLHEDTAGGQDSAPPGPDDSGAPPEDTNLPAVRPNPPGPPAALVVAPPTEHGEDSAAGGVCTLAAYRNTGTLKWVAWDMQVDCGGHAPALADLEADGDVEVVVGPWIIDGATGDVVAQGQAGQGRHLAYPRIGMHSVVADLDGDNVQEIVAGRSVYDPAGEEICSIDEALDDGFAAVADLDGDGFGDFVVVGNGAARTFDRSCQPMASWTLQGGGTGGPPTIGDFDSDGLPEVGLADAGVYAVYESDGTLLWAVPVTDASSHATGSVVFDFEGDGYPEAVYADETALFIFDGRTGEVRLQDTAHTSRTLHEFPTVVDVDADGLTEILVSNGGGHYESVSTGIYSLGSANDDWLGNRQVWNQHAYSITNINDDLSIPSPPDPNWPQHNNFRSGDPHPITGGRSPDAVPLADPCMLECEQGFVVLEASVGNSGLGMMRDGVPMSIYAVTQSGQVLLDTVYTANEVAPGETSESFQFRIATSELADGTLVVAVDDDGSGLPRVRECHEDNNLMLINDLRC